MKTSFVLLSEKNVETVEDYAKLIGEEISVSDVTIDNWNVYNKLIAEKSSELKKESEILALVFREIVIPYFNKRFKVFKKEQKDGIITIGASSTNCG